MLASALSGSACRALLSAAMAWVSSSFSACTVPSMRHASTLLGCRCTCSMQEVVFGWSRYREAGTYASSAVSSCEQCWAAQQMGSTDQGSTTQPTSLRHWAA